MHHAGRRFCLLAIPLLFLQCGGSSGPAGTSDPPPGTGPPAPGPPNPRTVAVTRDGARRVAAVVTADAGGTVVAIAADGTRLTLALPPGALMADVEVALTPIADVGGLPLSGGFVGGAHVEPEGLVLILPAMLTIELARDPPTTGGLSLLGFAYRGDGTEFHLYPAAVAGRTVTMPVFHFSGYGGGSGTESDAARQRSENPPTDPLDRELQNLTTEADAVFGWGSGLMGPVGGASSAAELGGLYLQLIAWTTIAEQFFADARIVQLHGTLWDLYAASVSRVLSSLLDECAAAGRPENGLTVIRILDFIRRQPELVRRVDTAGIEARLSRCLTFELDFQTTLDVIGGGSVQSALVQGTGIFGLDRDLRLLAPAEVPLDMFDASFVPPPPCTASPNVSPQPSVIPGAELVASPYDANTLTFTGGTSLALFLGFDPRQETGTLTVSCPDLPPQVLPADGLFYEAPFVVLHLDELDFEWTFRIVFAEAALGREPFAERRYDASVPIEDVTVSEDTTFRVHHRPQGE